ncbi:Protein virilizer [Halotydeus destructor]|nr:Protein virilizer [Halotydeus destructor]
MRSGKDRPSEYYPKKYEEEGKRSTHERRHERDHRDDKRNEKRHDDRRYSDEKRLDRREEDWYRDQKHSRDRRSEERSSRRSHKELDNEIQDSRYQKDENASKSYRGRDRYSRDRDHGKDYHHSRDKQEYRDPPKIRDDDQRRISKRPDSREGIRKARTPTRSRSVSQAKDQSRDRLDLSSRRSPRYLSPAVMSSREPIRLSPVDSKAQVTSKLEAANVSVDRTPPISAARSPSLERVDSPTDLLPVFSPLKDVPTPLEHAGVVEEDSLEPITPEIDAESISSTENIDFTDENHGLTASEDDREFDAISSNDDESVCLDEALHEMDDAMLDDCHDDDGYDYKYKLDFQLYEFTAVAAEKAGSAKSGGDSQLANVISQFRTPESRNEKWVEVLENLTSDSLKDGEKFFDELVDWLKSGLDFELAIQQPVTPFKVRHMKAGVTLASLMISLGDGVLIRLLDQELPRMLIELYEKPYMSLAVKLMIVASLDSLCNSVLGMEHYLNVNYTIGEESMTCYQKCLRILMSNPSTRIASAIAVVMRKVKVFEAILMIQSLAPNSKDVKAEDLTVLAALDCLLQATSTPQRFFVNPLRFLPTSRQFHALSTSRSSCEPLLNWWRGLKFLSNLVLVVEEHENNEEITEKVVFILNNMTKNHDTMKYLVEANQVESLNNLKNALMKVESMKSVAEDVLVRIIVFHILTVLTESIAGNEIDEHTLCECLWKLYMLSVNPATLGPLANVLMKTEMFSSVLNVLKLTEDSLNNQSLAVAEYYATEIVCSTLSYPVDNGLDSYIRHSEHLVDLLEFSPSLKLRSLAGYVSPLKSKDFSYTEETFAYLIDFLKNELNLYEASNSTLRFKAKPELITVLRVLNSLCISPETASINFPHDSQELQYLYGVTQVCALDGVSILSQLLNKLYDSLTRPSNGRRAVFDFVSLLSFIYYSLKIIKVITEELISARRRDFQDLSVLPLLFKLYSILSSLANKSSHTHLIEHLKEIIIDTLLLFTSFSAESENAEDSLLANSLWTKMFKTLLHYTISSPSNFLSGLSMLCELLPLPLSVDEEEPSGVEADKISNMRKLWTAHILVLEVDVEHLLVSLEQCTDVLVRDKRRQLALTISDLTANSELKRKLIEHDIGVSSSVLANLAEMAANCENPFDLKSSLSQQFSMKDTVEIIKKSDGTNKTCELLISAKETLPFAKRPYATSGRGRGFGRVATSVHRTSDSFRSRPPNTSRPPSVHVDDFMAREGREPTTFGVKRPKDFPRHPTSSLPARASSFADNQKNSKMIPVQRPYRGGDYQAPESTSYNANPQIKREMRQPR